MILVILKKGRNYALEMKTTGRRNIMEVGLVQNKKAIW